jgi:site-specific recombinase XerD
LRTFSLGCSSKSRIERNGTFSTDWLTSKLVLTTPATYAKYASAINHFLASLSEKRRTASVGSITATEIERWLNAGTEEGLTGTTVNKHLMILRTAFNHARRQGMRPRIPTGRGSNWLAAF